MVLFSFVLTAHKKLAMPVAAALAALGGVILISVRFFVPFGGFIKHLQIPFANPF